MPDPLDVVKKAIAEGGTGADAPNHLQKVKLWDRVELDDGRKGAVKFMGRVPERKFLIGIEIVASALLPSNN